MSSSPQTTGAAASFAWLEARGLDPARTPQWYVEITIESDAPDIRFEINIYPEEWGFIFRVGRRVSSIRITDVAFVHGQDDHRLLNRTPPLEHVIELLEFLERTHALTFARAQASVKSNLIRAASVVRSWFAYQGKLQ